jgi:hypothetical protein
MKDDDPDRIVCSICGTRFIEYLTANRLDKNDRTLERLAADLQAATDQLWGRREVTFTTATSLPDRMIRCPGFGRLNHIRAYLLAILHSKAATDARLKIGSRSRQQIDARALRSIAPDKF